MLLKNLISRKRPHPQPFSSSGEGSAAHCLRSPLLVRRGVRGEVLSLFLLLFSLSSSAQQTKIDSLTALLKTDKEDTGKVNHLNALGWELMYNNPDTAILLSEQALEILSSKFQISSSKFQEEKKTLGLGALDLKLGSFLAKTLGQLGAYNYLKADYSKALDYHLKALKIDDVILSEAKNLSEKQAAQKGIATRLGNIGNVYKDQADYPKALDYYLKALKTFEELGNKNGIANNLGNIGIVYRNQADYPKALDYYLKALKMDEELGNKNGIAIRFGNIGIVYSQQAEAHPNPSQREGLYNKALDYYLKALKMAEELGNKNLQANTLGNIGNVYKEQADYPKALDYYLKALKMDEELRNKNGIAADLGNIGSLYTAQKKYKEAEEYLMKALELDKETGAQKQEMDVENYFTELYEKTNRHQLALEHYKKAIVLKDTLFSEENKKQLIRKEMNFEFEKKEAAAKAEQEKQAAVAAEKAAAAAAESRKQKTIIWLFVALTAAAAVAATIIFRSLKVTRRQKGVIEKQKALVDIRNKEIEEQKKLVEQNYILLEQAKKHIDEKHKEVTDSINYAKRIQNAILPSVSAMEKTLSGFQTPKGLNPDFFLLYLPKDVVAGDFYWMEVVEGEVTGNQYSVTGKKENENTLPNTDYRSPVTIFLAACDCTGHGVPGAMVSVVCSNALSKALLEEGITDTGKLLDRTRELVIERFGKSGEEVKDGMDVSLLKIEFPSPTERDGRVRFQWSGANNCLWYIARAVIPNEAQQSEESPSTDSSASPQNDKFRLIEITADKQPIGKFDFFKPFTTHTIEAHPRPLPLGGEKKAHPQPLPLGGEKSAGDKVLPNGEDLGGATTFYLFTDGLPDQFGGPKGKKFMYKRFEELLLSNASLSMEEQKEKLSKALADWKGTIEQVDDITVIGVRV